ncbi:MAG TPA: VWA domain-containing protein [Lacunisphaera sp.]|nr:VWA domain-containing protein [Lacunisphaera sp.]
MTFIAPEWLFLLPALIVVGWRVPRLRLHEPLRAIALVVLTLALADPQMRLGGGGLDLWVLADRSDSAAGLTVRQMPEVAAILEKSKGRDDRVRWIDYAVEPVRRDQGDPEFRGTQQTRTGAALDYALGQLDPDRAARLLVLTDGYATEPLGDAAEKLLRRGVPLDYRLVGESAAVDYRVGGLMAPNRVLPGEAFLVDFVVTGSKDAHVPWEVWRAGRKAGEGMADVRRGVARVRLTDRLGGSGAAHYEVRIKPVQDAQADNNLAGAWVEVTGGPRTLLITPFTDDPLAPLLKAQGLDVEVVTDPARLGAAMLAGARCVVLNNMPAHRLPAEFMGALDFWVNEQGGGLMMAGGPSSFGAGGYFSSPIDPLLPVSMELRNEHRKLTVAMSIILDRSGSMAVGAGGGLTKMDLADAGAARAIELLGDMDAVAVLAVDSSPHLVVELAEVKSNRRRMTDAVRRIASQGGGIFTYTGLKAGWEELQKAQTGQRHIILFADANDAEEPGHYEKLLEEIRAAGGTVSVIGLGTEGDSDAAFLKDVALRGGGRIFFNAEPAELPAVFAQETVSVARSAFIKEETPVQGTPGWTQLAARTPRWMETVDGYNLSYLRPGATAALVTTDEYKAPLVAAWSRGAGRVAAVSFPLGGQHSGKVRAWPDYGDFVQTLARWLAGDEAPPGAALRTEVTGGQLALELLHDESWAARIAQAAPTATLAESVPGRGAAVTRELVWEKIEPGRYRATTALTPGQMARGAVRIGGVALPFGPLAAASAEWDFDRARLAELRQLSERSGGRERIDLAAIWDTPRDEHQRSLRAWLLAFFTVVLLADAALTRLEISLVPARWRR